jgi:hypothetical protein
MQNVLAIIPQAAAVLQLPGTGFVVTNGVQQHDTRCPQSDACTHPKPSHDPHVPPQSTPVSSPSWQLSEHVGGEVEHVPPWQHDLPGHSAAVVHGVPELLVEEDAVEALDVEDAVAVEELVDDEVADVADVADEALDVEEAADDAEEAVVLAAVELALLALVDDAVDETLVGAPPELAFTPPSPPFPAVLAFPAPPAPPVPGASV